MSKIIMKIPTTEYNKVKKHIVDLFATGKKISVANLLTEMVISEEIPESLCLPRDFGTGATNQVLLDVPEDIYNKVTECSAKSTNQCGHWVTIHNIILSLIIKKINSLKKAK